jgi:hypothetical protein
LFESRETGRITIWQWPNTPLWVYIAATVLRVAILATIALAVWAGLEVLRGVNPFRRSLGAVVLIGVILRI